MTAKPPVAGRARKLGGTAVNLDIKRDIQNMTAKPPVAGRQGKLGCATVNLDMNRVYQKLATNPPACGRIRDSPQSTYLLMK